MRRSEVDFGSTASSSPIVFSRRKAVAALGLGLVNFAHPGRNALAEPTRAAGKRSSALLAQHQNVQDLDTRSKIVIELDGQLKIKEPDPNKPDENREADVKGKSTLDYFERIAFNDSSLVATARSYIEAKGENWISGSAASLELRPECRQTRMLPSEGRWEQFCPTESLDQRELDLLNSPINTAELEKLLPIKPATPESSWTVSENDAKDIFNLDAVHKSTLKAKISKVEKGIATIEFEGKLDATAQSVTTNMEVKGNFQAKYTGTCVLVTWLGMVINETRAISQSEPGFTIKARLRLIRAEIPTKLSVTTDALRKLAEKDDPGRWLITLRAKDGMYQMLGDRRWKTYLDSGEQAVLRCIENNTVVAQCNISRQPALDKGAQLTLEAFQAQVRNAIGDRFTEFLESNEKKTSGNLRLIRTVANGMAEDVPVQWIYNHLSDDDGNRMVVIYTMGGNVTDKFAAADEQMISSFELMKNVRSASSANSPTLAPTPESVKR